MKKVTVTREISELLIADMPDGTWCNGKRLMTALLDAGYARSSIYYATEKMGIECRYSGRVGPKRETWWRRPSHTA